jgi:NADH-quinone oxidoreductase subunit L
MITVALLILLLPLLSFAIQIFFRKFIESKNGEWISIGIQLTTLGLAFYLFAVMIGHYDPHFRIEENVTWFNLGNFSLEMGILIDNISVIMLLVVALISSLVHIYSTEYMKGDIRFSRYYGFLGIFTFSMNGIVLANNFFMIYVFWELVGLSSYLLIGHWWEKNSAADASKKAFITNRVGDIGMFMGLMIIMTVLGTLNYQGVYTGIASGEWEGGIGTLFGGANPHTLLTWAGILLFMGAVGKSAQFPLHIWLPDAMEGPTPVSALIHAATMVAAGVYLTVRIFPILTPDAMATVAFIGGVTAFYAATIAITQNDIKKVLAYSTVSQLGYMIMALGTGAYVAGFFHLITHAMFKAGLFLASGSVIHAMHHALHDIKDHDTDAQDMRNMGGLKSKMPYTYLIFIVASLSISGIPFFSGFLSKDAILAGSWAYASTAHEGWLASMHMAWILPFFGFGAAVITAFYMFRLIFMTFFGESKRPDIFEKMHESPKAMTVPLMILAALSLFFFYTIPSINPFSTHGWFSHVIENPGTVVNFGSTFNLEHFEHANHEAHMPAMILSLIVATLGIGFATLVYLLKKVSAESLASKLGVLYKGSFNKWYMDEFYINGIIRPFLKGCDAVALFDMEYYDHYLINGAGRNTKKVSSGVGVADDLIVDGAVNFSGYIFQWLGWSLKFIQTGRIQNYLIFALIGVVAVFLLNAF